MFIGDEVRAEACAAAAATRLAALARGSSLTQASHAAWDAGIASSGQTGPEPVRLLRVHCRGPVQRGAVSVLILRWEAAAGSGLLFPALDADITLLSDGEQATLVGLTGVYRTLAGTRPDQPAVRGVGAVTIRTLLNRVADGISDPAAPPGVEPGAASGWPATSRASADGHAHQLIRGSSPVQPARSGLRLASHRWAGPRNPCNSPAAVD
jgi:hypothetical protein